jgi:hypothetical protein
MTRFFLLVALVLTLVACGGGLSSNSSANTGLNAGDLNLGNGTSDSNSANSNGTPAASNVVDLLVDSGPDSAGVNRLYTSVTICKPGSATLCKTIDHVLVDTGSVGLRLLASEVPANLQLSAAKDTLGNVLLGCAKFLDGDFAWGPLALADVELGALTASDTTVQLVGHSDYDQFQSQCSSGGNPIITARDLGAKGILGVGLSKQDCGSACELQGRRSARNGKYFACINAACSAVTGTTLAIDKQLQHVIARFPTDNNGFAIQMDSVPSGGSATASGKMIVGLGTRTNNQFPSMQVLPTTSQGYLYGTLSSNSAALSRSYSSTFMDTGSNGIFFDALGIPSCTYPNDSGFYCPLSDIVFNVLLGNVGAAQAKGSFTVTNAAAIFQKGNAALPTLGGSLYSSGLLDLGLPFFYGKTVVIGIEGMPATGVGASKATGPFYAL